MSTSRWSQRETSRELYPEAVVAPLLERLPGRALAATATVPTFVRL
jgi:hypothetical protein